MRDYYGNEFTITPATHDWALNDDGSLDDFFFESGYCNGPGCKRCGAWFCEHCEDRRGALASRYVENCPDAKVIDGQVDVRAIALVTEEKTDEATGAR